MSKQKAGSSKAKGKRGESSAKKFLKEKKWYISSTEVQGLAGDDIFARSPDGVWYSIEVKNTNKYDPKFLAQAKRQAEERFCRIQDELNGDFSEYLYAVGMHQYTKNNYLLMWHPTNSNTRGNTWVVAVADGSYTKFLAPFDGQVS